MRSSFVCLALLALCSSACRFGEAAFTSQIDGLAFDPGGTVFSYVDARDAALAESLDPPVVVAMTWIVFDPGSDLGDYDGASLFGMAHEMAQRDALSVVFARQGALEPGAAFSVTVEGDEVVAGADLSFAAHFAPERLDASSTYSAIEPLGSRRTLDITVDAVAFSDADAGVAGTATLTIEAVEGRDIGAARRGVIEGTFRAPLVSERTAERNLALLAANEAVLPLPTAGRGAP